MGVVQVDIGVLRSNAVAMAALNDPPTGGEAGILYVSSTSAHLTNPAVRLINGGTIPTSDGRRTFRHNEQSSLR